MIATANGFILNSKNFDSKLQFDLAHSLTEYNDAQRTLF